MFENDALHSVARRSCSRMVAKSAGRTPQSTSVASHSLHLSHPLIRVALLKFQAPAGVGSHEKAQTVCMASSFITE